MGLGGEVSISLRWLVSSPGSHGRSGLLELVGMGEAVPVVVLTVSSHNLGIETGASQKGWNESKKHLFSSWETRQGYFSNDFAKVLPHLLIHSWFEA